MEQKRLCAICNRVMDHHNAIAYIDFTCKKDQDHHVLIERFRDNQLVKLKTRLMDEGTKLYVKFHFDRNQIEVWTKTNDANRIIVDSIFEPDFSDLNKIKQKIRTYLIFS